MTPVALIVPVYPLLGLFVTLGCAIWAAWVGLDRFHMLNRELRRSVVGGLVIIALLLPPVAVAAAYWSKVPEA